MLLNLRLSATNLRISFATVTHQHLIKIKRPRNKTSAVLHQMILFIAIWQLDDSITKPNIISVCKCKLLIKTTDQTIHIGLPRSDPASLLSGPDTNQRRLPLTYRQQTTTVHSKAEYKSGKRRRL